MPITRPPGNPPRNHRQLMAYDNPAQPNAPLRRRATGRARLTGWALLGALAMLIPGLALPTLHLVSLGFLHHEYSLFTAILAFWDKQHYSLFALVLAFTVIFPLAKITAGLWLFYLASPRPAKAEKLGRPAGHALQVVDAGRVHHRRAGARARGFADHRRQPGCRYLIVCGVCSFIWLGLQSAHASLDPPN